MHFIAFIIFVCKDSPVLICVPSVHSSGRPSTELILSKAVISFTYVLIKPSLHNTHNNSCNYYNYSTKQHVSNLFGHHQAYKTVVLLKVHSVLPLNVP